MPPLAGYELLLGRTLPPPPLRDERGRAGLGRRAAARCRSAAHV